MNKLLYILIFLSLIFVSIILFVIYASNNNQTTTVTTSSPTPIQKDTTIASIAPSIKPTKIITPTPTKNTSTKLNWGAWVSWKVSEVNDFQTKVGKTMNYIVTFVHWGNENELPLDLGNLGYCQALVCKN